MNQKRSLLGGLAKSLGGKAAGSTDVQGALTGELADHQLWKCLHPAGIRPLCSSTPLCPERRLPLLHHLPNTPAGFPALAASLMPPRSPTPLPRLAPPFLQAAIRCCIPWPLSRSGALPRPMSLNPRIPFQLPLLSGSPRGSCASFPT